MRWRSSSDRVAGDDDPRRRDVEGPWPGGTPTMPISSSGAWPGAGTRRCRRPTYDGRGAVRVQVRPAPAVEVLRSRRGSRPACGSFSGGSGSGLLNRPEVLERRELVGDHAAVVVVLVHLQRVDAQRVLGRHRVAQRAFGPAGEVPGLLAACRRGPSGRVIVYVRSRPLASSSVGVGLVVVPDVGVAAPELVADFLGAGQRLEMQQPRLQPPRLSGCPSPVSRENVLTSTVPSGNRQPGGAPGAGCG